MGLYDGQNWTSEVCHNLHYLSVNRSREPVLTIVRYLRYRHVVTRKAQTALPNLLLGGLLADVS